MTSSDYEKLAKFVGAAIDDSLYRKHPGNLIFYVFPDGCFMPKHSWQPDKKPEQWYLIIMELAKQEHNILKWPDNERLAHVLVKITECPMCEARKTCGQ